MTLKCLSGVGAVALGLSLAVPAGADDLLAKAKAGEPVRIGFANEVPWAYPGENNQPLGFVNTHVLGVLSKMGRA